MVINKTRSLYFLRDFLLFFFGGGGGGGQGRRYFRDLLDMVATDISHRGPAHHVCFK